MRARRTAEYQWLAAPTASQRQVIQQACGTVASVPLVKLPLLQAWHGWHAKAAAAFVRAVDLDVAVRVVKAERDKGSCPSARRVPSLSCHRPAESIH